MDENGGKGIRKRYFLSVAVHPSNPDILAAAGSKGLYLSKDKGETFQLITKGLQGTMVFMTEDILWYGGFNGDARLMFPSNSTHSFKKQPFSSASPVAIVIS